MSRLIGLLVAPLCALVLAACGGRGDDAGSDATEPAGELQASEVAPAPEHPPRGVAPLSPEPGTGPAPPPAPLTPGGEAAPLEEPAALAENSFYYARAGSFDAIGLLEAFVLTYRDGTSERVQIRPIPIPPPPPLEPPPAPPAAPGESPAPPRPDPEGRRNMSSVETRAPIGMARRVGKKPGA